VYSDSSTPPSASSAQSPFPNATRSKTAQAIWDNIFAFPPNRDTLGGTAYLIVENEGNILIDCPAWDEANQKFLHDLGGVRSLFITHRGGIGKAQEIQETFNCEIFIQEQEAYLLPGLKVTTSNRSLPLVHYPKRFGHRDIRLVPRACITVLKAGCYFLVVICSPIN
jgi:glyoxylase-like metal-dependent hydrolase (beta-lactamase superfamily II)